MTFEVVELSGRDRSRLPRNLSTITPLVPTSTRQVSLNEEESQEVCVEVKSNGTVMQIKSVKPGPGFADDCEAAGYVWHCHILEHEDNEMMRPYCVGDAAKCPVPTAP